MTRIKHLADRLNRHRRIILWIGIFVLLLALALYQLWFGPARRERQIAQSHYTASAIALNSGDDGKVETELLAAITAWPEDADIYDRLGDFYRLHNEPELAAVAYLRLLQISPHAHHVYCRLAQAALDQGAEEDARRYAEQELKLAPKCVLALDTMALLKLKFGEYKVGTADAVKAYHLAPKDPRAIITYAQCYLMEDPAKALQVLESNQSTLPKTWEVAYDLGYCYAHGSADPAAMSKAVAQLRRAEMLAPNESTVHRELGRILLQQHQLPEAEKEGALAVKTGPNDPEGLLVYSQVLQREGKTAEASKIEARFRALDDARLDHERLKTRYGAYPNDAKMAHQMAADEMRLGHVREAVNVLENASSLHPGDKQLRRDMLSLLQSGISP